MNCFNKIDDYIYRHMRELNAPGLTIGITDQNDLLWSKSYGYANIGSEEKVTPETLFQIGSMTKTFTAIALLQEVEAGKLDLQVPISEYLPWFELRSDHKINVHQLLTHTAGLPQGRDDIPTSKYMAAALAEYSPPFEPGSKHEYSDVGYQILGFILEALNDKTYGEIIKERILVPLEMTDTLAAITHRLRKRLAVGYKHFYDDRPAHLSHPIVPAPWIVYDAADASISSTAEDMSKFMRMLLNRGKGPKGPLISEESFELMTREHAERWPNSYYGYGSYVRQMDGNDIIGHGGNMIGFQSMMLADLDTDIGIVACINGPGFPYYVVTYALEVMREELVGDIEAKSPAPLVSYEVSNASDYIGSFRSGQRSFEIEADDNNLILIYEGQKITLEDRGRDLFYVNHPDFELYLLEFHRDEDDKVVEAFHGPDWYTNQQYEGPAEFEVNPDWDQYTGFYRTQNPWVTNFEIVCRKGRLVQINPGGLCYEPYEDMLVPDELEGKFRLGSKDSTEWLKFDTIADGKALRVEHSGCYYYRSERL